MIARLHTELAEKRDVQSMSERNQKPSSDEAPDVDRTGGQNQRVRAYRSFEAHRSGDGCLQLAVRAKPGDQCLRANAPQKHLRLACPLGLVSSALPQVFGCFNWLNTIQFADLSQTRRRIKPLQLGCLTNQSSCWPEDSLTSSLALIYPSSCEATSSH